MLSWTVTVNVSSRVGHSPKDVCSCSQEFGGNQWSPHSNDVIVFWLNKEDLRRQRTPPCKKDVALSLRKDMQQILSLTMWKLQRVSAAKVHVTCEPNCGVCCEEIDSQWSCFSLHIAAETPFTILFQWPQVNTLSAKFPPFKIFVTLLSKCTSPKGNLKYGFHTHQICTYLNFIMLVVCNPDVFRVCNIKNNFNKHNLSLHNLQMHVLS
jgi:hypothetical protein